MARDWPLCLQATAASCDILQEAEKFTLEEPTTGICTHQVLTLLEHKGGYWLTAGQMGKYQAILLDNPNVITNHPYLKHSRPTPGLGGKPRPPM